MGYPLKLLGILFRCLSSITCTIWYSVWFQHSLFQQDCMKIMVSLVLVGFIMTVLFCMKFRLLFSVWPEDMFYKQLFFFFFFPVYGDFTVFHLCAPVWYIEAKFSIR